MRRFPVISLILAAFLFSLTGSSCPGPNTTVPKDRVAGLKAFKSAEELRQFLASQAKGGATANSQGGYWRLGTLLEFFAAPVAGALSDTNSTTGGNGKEESTPYSSTNVQELGVDESDIVKNDGETIYWLNGDTIHVAKAVPANGVDEVATIKLEAPADSMFLREGKLIVLMNKWSYYYAYDYVSWFRGSGGAVIPMEAQVADANGDNTSSDVVGGPWNDGGEVLVAIYDVSNPASPVLSKTLKFEGGLSGSRMIDNHLHIVLYSTPRLYNGTDASAIDDMTLDEWIPDYEITDGMGVVINEGNIAPWSNFYRPEVGDGFSITTVVTVDVDNPTAEFKSTAITANTETIYASTEALYITDTKYEWETGNSRTDTMVHKVAFTADGSEYKASGLVPGRPLNQYSLGEFNGYLRMATTQEQWTFEGGADTRNGVYVLHESGADLEITGKIENLALGETIYAARFIGPRGFLVTFKRVDPLFTLDLTDPQNPQVVGKLKVPGYSDHIQLLDENHLLTIGKDAVDTGSSAWVQGVQLTIFDITDFANPVIPKAEGKKFKVVIGSRGTNSEANYNPKAFNYFAAKEALAFPVDIYEEGMSTDPWDWGTHTFNGLIVYHVNAADGFTELGRIPMVTDDQASGGCFWNYYGFSRGVFIGDYVYAVSNLGVKAAALSDVSTLVGETGFTGAALEENCWNEGIEILPAEAGGLQ